ncbi:MAG TPA: sigma-70 family RNA polymerase sigma factor [Streptosporangiaceae bacterium]|nr:sigma-70 family RNA polymerase sigma factor [Streptosporangiaceae bacterium]
MDDREAVAAILADDPAGLVDVYDRYATSLYGYCRTLLHAPADAADAVQETFVIATARLGALRDARKLRPWLYAVARNESLRKLRPREAPAAIWESEDLSETADLGQSAQRHELREMVRTAILGLTPADREVIELNLRHDLDGAELGAVLGMSRSQAQAMASRARGQLEQSLGALLVARSGRRACPVLNELLADWDGRLATLLGKRVSRHLDGCAECGERKGRALGSAMEFGIPALPLLPPVLRNQVLRLCADESPDAVDVRKAIVRHAGSFGPNGFPRPLRRDGRGKNDPGAGIVAAVSVAAAAAVVIAMIALRGSTPSTLDARSGTGGPSPVTSSAQAPSPSSAPVAPTPERSRSKAKSHPSRTATVPPATFFSTPTKSPKPRKSPKPTHSASPTPSPSATPSTSPSPTTTPSPTSTPTPTHSPTTGTT